MLLNRGGEDQRAEDSGSRVLFINKFYLPKTGGVESVVAQHAGFLQKEGFDVTVLCCSDRPSVRTRSEVREGIRVIRCASLGTLFSMPVSPVFPLWLWRIGRRNALAVFHLPFPLGTLPGLFLTRRIPRVVFWHSDIVRQRVLGQLLRPFQRMLCRQAERVLTTSSNLARSSRVLPEFADKVGVVPISVPEPPGRDDPVPVSDRPETLPDISTPFGLFLGRLCYYKGIDVLVQALGQLPKEDQRFPVVIAGAGPLDEQIAGDLESCPHPRVTFLPRFMAAAEKAWLLGNAGFFLFPSTEASEAFGIMQLEAMRMGVPVINTALPTGSPWVSVDGESGLTVPPREPQALAGAMSRLIRHPQERRALGEGARERVRACFGNEGARRLLRSEIQTAIAAKGT